MENWVIITKGADFRKIGQTFGISPVTARLIRNRDILGDDAIRDYLYGDPTELPDPSLMKDMDRTVRILKEKIAGGALIRVVGDYDIDGVMASYILKRGLSGLGARIDVTLPHRVRDGYGISERIIEEAYRDQVDTIITCDNGISAGPVIQKAKDLGMTVLVTDHHNVNADAMPKADACIDPKQTDCAYPFKELCGAGIAWRLISLMDPSQGEELLPFAAFATIGDIVSLRDDNRKIVKKGLELLRNTDNPGLRALMEVNTLSQTDLSAYHIGFVLGPCINAAGRLDSALLAEALLEAEDDESALRLALQLKDLNDRRKTLTEQGTALAESQLESRELADQKVYVIYLPSVHESVVGIIAGRICEKYHRPTIILTDSGSYLKGSGRSVEGYHMFDALKSCEDILVKFGGHPMAAGVTLEADKLEELRTRLNAFCTMSEQELAGKVRIDMELSMSYVTEDLLEEWQLLEPYGQDNPEPVFALRNVCAEKTSLVGKEGNVLRMTLVQEDGYRFSAVAFKQARELLERIRADRHLTILYYPTVNEFRGERTIQAVVTGFR